MSPGDGHDPRMPGRVVGIAAAIGVMVAGILLLGPGLAPWSEAFPGTPVDLLVPPEEPIAAEAGVFRMRPGDLAADPDAQRRPEAHPRTLRMYRALRAYPGAPPRIPHGLTDEEFRAGRCNVCHEKGGYVARFAAYAPVTPHPELFGCLQCHVPDDALVGREFPRQTSGRDVCLQCHILDRAPPLWVELDWAPRPWPELDGAALEGSPPVVPHGFQLRQNCMACHVGAGAVEEIRTDHGDRANCRQCHVAVDDFPGDGPTDEFTRPAAASEPMAGGER